MQFTYTDKNVCEKKVYGFTMIELMIVIAVFAVVLMISGAFAGISVGENHLNTAVVDVVSMLRRAQWQTMNGSSDEVWGVHFESDSYTLFMGDSYVPGGAGNLVTEFESTIFISSITITGGGDDVIFSRPMGETSTDGTIIIESGEIGESTTVSVNAAGMVDDF